MNKRYTYLIASLFFMLFIAGKTVAQSSDQIEDLVSICSTGDVKNCLKNIDSTWNRNSKQKVVAAITKKPESSAGFDYIKKCLTDNTCNILTYYGENTQISDNYTNTINTNYPVWTGVKEVIDCLKNNHCAITLPSDYSKKINPNKILFAKNINNNTEYYEYNRKHVEMPIDPGAIIYCYKCKCCSTTKYSVGKYVTDYE